MKILFVHMSIQSDHLYSVCKENETGLFHMKIASTQMHVHFC